MKFLAPTARRVIRWKAFLNFRLASIFLFTLALQIAVPCINAQGTAVRVDTFSFKPNGQVQIENTSGVTRVVVWDNQTVRVRAEKKAPAYSSLGPSDLVLMSAGDTVIIKCRQGGERARIDFTVHIPRRAQLQITGGAWPVEVSGPLASAVVETTSGSINYELPNSDDARVSLRSSRGVVRSTLPLSVSQRTGLRGLQGRLGSGAAPIILNSQSGNITLSPAPDIDLIARDANQPGGDSSIADSSASEPQVVTRSQDVTRGRISQPSQQSPPVTRENRDQPSDVEGDYSDAQTWPRPQNSNRSSGNGSVVFAGSSQNEDESQTQRGGPFTRPRRETRSTDSSAGLSVRIIPSNTPLGRSTNDPAYDDAGEDDNYPATRPANRSSANQSRSSDPQSPGSRQPSRSTYDPQSSAYDPWGNKSSDVDDSTIETAPPNNRRAAPPVLQHRGGSDNSTGSAPLATLPASSETTESGEEEGAIKLQASLVNLNVSVTNRSGLALPSLKKEDFELLENGERQSIEFFAPTAAPFNLVLLLDLSGSIRDKLDVVKSAALKFLEVIGPQDRVAVVTFTDEIRVISQLTADRDSLRKQIKAIKYAEGGTSFYDATWWAMVNTLRGTHGQRNAIVVMTDGVDSSLDRFNPAPTRVSFAQLARRLEESDVIVFPVYLDTEYEEVFERGNSAAEAYAIARYQLERLSEMTGGQMFQAKEAKDLAGVYKEVAAALRTVYSVGYYPINPERDGTFRRVRVMVNRPEAVVRTRKGYYAR